VKRYQDLSFGITTCYCSDVYILYGSKQLYRRTTGVIPQHLVCYFITNQVNRQTWSKTSILLSPELSNACSCLHYLISSCHSAETL